MLGPSTFAGTSIGSLAATSRWLENASSCPRLGLNGSNARDFIWSLDNPRQATMSLPLEDLADVERPEVE